MTLAPSPDPADTGQTPTPSRGDPAAGVWAHSANEHGEWHDLEAHLRRVAELAREFATPFGAGDWAYVAGLWHDLGKFAPAFQEYLRSAAADDYHAAEMRGSIDHTSAGAQQAVATYGVLGHLLAFVTAGHHSGLLDAIADGACLEKRLHKSTQPWQHGLSIVPPPGELQLPGFLRSRLAHRSSDQRGVGFSFAFFVRMLFSCLVDADFLDTEAFLDPRRAAARPYWGHDALARMERALAAFVGQLPCTGSHVVTCRHRVREACVAAADKPPGFFSLTVPTGGGKTLSSMAFALRHARLHDLRRVIYVAPFTTIIEQTAAVFRHVFGELGAQGWPDPIVEHHSALEATEETLAGRLAAENWDAPVIVTTAVQFYESLFANRTSRCRKLHNLVRSVIILDEAQKLPVDYLAPCLQALQELVMHYGTTVVLCTATQPAVQLREEFPIGLREVREIVQEPASLYRKLKRVQVVDLGPCSDEELASRLSEESQVLCIVNTRRHAREIFQRMGSVDAIHLSAAMCPEHRTHVLSVIRRDLEAEKPCRVISTQLVEAGVDLDFPVVYRSMAGLDSLAQAAGRCNRNGRLCVGKTFLFTSEHQEGEVFLRDTAKAARQVIGCGTQKPLYEDVLALEAVEHYFRLYYWDQRQRWDARQILDNFLLQNRADLPFLFAFRKSAADFRLIDDAGQPVIVPWGERGRQLCASLRQPGRTLERGLLRALQRFTVQVPMRVWRAELGRAVELVHQQFPVLTCPDIYYDDRLGLVLDRQDLSPETFLIEGKEVR